MDFLRQLETRRSQIVREFELNLAAIDRLIALERGGKPALLDSETTAGHVVRAQLSARRVIQRGVRPTSLAGQILGIIDSYPPDQEWTSSSLWEELHGDKPSVGYQLSDDELKAKNAISATLGQLLRSARITQIKASNGAEPAIYRTRKAVKGQEPTEAGS